MSKVRNSWYLAAAVVALLVISFLQRGIDPLYPQFLPKQQMIVKGEVQETQLLLELPQQFLGLAFAGFREMAAGLLWVRADEFFHTGNYEALMPIFRMVTWLDPHQIIVYATGAWHLDYNFTDSYARSDRRYIPASISLLEEGIANNPRGYELYFELAWTHYYQKIKDYDKAVEWAEKAVQLPAIDPNTGREIDRPLFVDRMLAHMYEKAGRLDDTDRQWRETLAKYKELQKEDPDGYEIGLALEVAQRNYNLFLMRQEWRETDTKPPLDAGFDVRVKRIGPKKLSIKGKVNLVPASEYKDLASESVTNYWRDKPEDEHWRDGARVRITLTDLGYVRPKLPRFNWEVDDSVTVLVDDTRIAGGEFETIVDLGRDPHIYPLKAEEYKLTLMIKPQETPDFVQDRIGWRGEGLTDQRCLDTLTVPGHNVIKWEKIYSREDLL